MRYTLKEIPYLLQNPVGRYELLLGQRHHLWPALRIMAAVYRRRVLRKTRFFAVTGSLGKSTTMRAVTAALGMPVPYIPPTNSWAGLALSILSVRRSAPYSVLEVGISRPGHMNQYARMICPDISVITSIAGEHYRSLGTLENIRSEKAEMVRSLPADGFAVLNGDDPNVLWMKEQISAKAVTYGFGEGNMVRADGFEINWPEGNRFSLVTEGTARTVQTRLFGRQMVYPILAGFAAATAAGRGLEQAASGLERLSPTPGRMELFMLDNGAAVLSDCFKGTLDTIHSALQTLSGISSGRRIVVLGEVEDAQGPRGQVHREIGTILARCASKAILICSRKTYGAVRMGAAGAGMNREAVVYAGHDWFDALQILKPDLKTGDIVLLKGRRTQRLERILLALRGRSMQCRTPTCKSSIKLCRDCPMLERGWDGLRITVQGRSPVGSRQ